MLQTQTARLPRIVYTNACLALKCGGQTKIIAVPLTLDLVSYIGEEDWFPIEDFICKKEVESFFSQFPKTAERKYRLCSSKEVATIYLARSY